MVYDHLQWFCDRYRWCPPPYSSAAAVAGGFSLDNSNAAAIANGFNLDIYNLFPV